MKYENTVAGDNSSYKNNYLIQYAPRPVIQSILVQNLVQWSDYNDTKGYNRVLEEAIDRAKKILVASAGTDERDA